MHLVGFLQPNFQQDIFYQVFFFLPSNWGMIRPMLLQNMLCNKTRNMESLLCYFITPFSVSQVAIFLQVYYNVFWMTLCFESQSTCSEHGSFPYFSVFFSILCTFGNTWEINKTKEVCIPKEENVLNPKRKYYLHKCC